MHRFHRCDKTNGSRQSLHPDRDAALLHPSAAVSKRGERALKSKAFAEPLDKPSMAKPPGHTCAYRDRQRPQRYSTW